MRKTSSFLADGRAVHYYDRDTTDRAPSIDQRDLPPFAAESRVRLDPITGEWVMVAGHRQARTYQPAADECPLCPTRGTWATDIPAASYDVVVFENRFPALAAIGPSGCHDDVTARSNLQFSAPAGGRCEVICFADEHDVTLADLKPDQVRLVLDAWIDRSRDLGARPDVAQVYCFENHGAEMGVTQPHPHGQIYAYPFVTPRTARMLARAADYRQVHGGNLFDDVLASEITDGARIVAQNGEWVAFVPFAARWPYEVHLYPRRRRPDLPALDEAQRDTFADIYLDLLNRFDRLFDTPAPYVSAWHQAPGDNKDDFAVHLELFTNRRASQRLKMLAGTELGMDTFSNDIPPEQAAALLREVGC